MDVQVEPVERLDQEKHYRDRDGESARSGPRCKAPDDECDQSVNDHCANHVTAGKAVAEVRHLLGEAGAVRVAHRSRRRRMVEPRLVQRFEDLSSAERDEALELIGMFGLGLLSAFMIALKSTTCKWCLDGLPAG